MIWISIVNNDIPTGRTEKAQHHLHISKQAKFQLHCYTCQKNPTDCVIVKLEFYKHYKQ